MQTGKAQVREALPPTHFVFSSSSLRSPLPPPNQKQQALHHRSLKSGVEISDPALAPAFASLRDSTSSVGWVLYTYAPKTAGNAGTKIALASTGQGLGSLVEVLGEEGRKQVYFGALRVKGRKTKEGQCKCLSFQWVGPEVGGMERGKAAMHKNGVVQGVMEGGVVGELKVEADEEEGWTTGGIEAAARKAVGAEEEEWTVGE